MLIGSGEPAAGAPAGRRGGLADSELVFSDLPGTTREDVLRELSRRVGALGAVPDADVLAARLLEREKLGCTGLGGGIAIPHCKLSHLAEVLIAVATTAAPVDFGAPDGIPVRVLFLVASPADAAAAHLQALARISRLLRTPGTADALRGADSAARLREVLRGGEAVLGVSS